MARYGMRRGMGQRLTEPGSKRYIDGRRPGRIAATGWTGVKHEQKCGKPQSCFCDHTDHDAECDPNGCPLF